MGKLLKMTVLTPIENVSVVKSTRMRPSPNRISTISLRMGRSPLWWMPRCSRCTSDWICGSSRSSSLSVHTALLKTRQMSFFSSSEQKSSLASDSASFSTSFLLKANTMHGSNSRSMIILTSLKISAECPFLRCLSVMASMSVSSRLSVLRRTTANR